MTPDNLSFIWALFALVLLFVIVDFVDGVLSRRRCAHRAKAVLTHAEHDERVGHWDTLATMQQLRDQHAQDQLNYGAPLHERPLDLEPEPSRK